VVKVTEWLKAVNIGLSSRVRPVWRDGRGDPRI